MAEVVEPGVTEDALASPRLGLAAGAFVEVGEVEGAEPVDRKALRDVKARSYHSCHVAMLESQMPMSAHAVTLHLESSLYDYFRQRAEHKQRSLEDELLETVEAAGPKAQELPESLAQAVAELPELADEALWRVARDPLPREAAAELEALNLKQQREGLSRSEEAALDRLIDAYERFLLLRAEAASLLRKRGHDVSELIGSE